MFLVSDLFDDAALARTERQIDEWLAREKAQNELILAVDRSTDQEIRWYVRMAGEEKEFTTVDCTKIWNTCNLRCKTNAASTMNTSCHNRLD